MTPYLHLANNLAEKATSIAHDLIPGGELGVPPHGYPSSKALYRKNDAHALLIFSSFYKTFYHRLMIYHADQLTTCLTNCDFISIRTCKEIKGKFCNYIEERYKKKVLLTGPMLPELDKSKQLEDQWTYWLNRFGQGSIVFCALGSQTILEKKQFHELCLGIELTGLPFLVAVKPPKERVKDHGMVWGELVQQQSWQPLLLAHPSVGCFVSHYGFGSMWESIISHCQIVLLPVMDDQVLTTKVMTEELEVSAEVKREETRWFSKENLSGAIMSLMDKDSEIGNQMRRNHSKLKETLASPGLLTGYTDKFIHTLENLVNYTNFK
ncbi:hypothetical protein CARUB_v10022332mg [Capsella rubella]|uniref:UDP-glycosyltransferases domain-containing protein n=1 Tax=Capsella rubella TaxID=81985 RepID=R0I9G4_9BRAS|nr:hypothetical protein CARUB_v10022332mg [Capsella rubella]